jgi:hypothetical protein
MGKKVLLPSFEQKPTTEEILNAILPPREWIDGGVHYVSYVSHRAANRPYVDLL